MSTDLPSGVQFQCIYHCISYCDTSGTSTMDIRGWADACIRVCSSSIDTQI